MTESNDEQRWPGWEAIEEEISIMCGDVAVYEFREPVLELLGASNALDNVAVHKHGGGDAHWHYVTYGLTELYEKITDDPDVSGMGFELSFRLACAEDEELPPAWPVDLLKRLARYVKRTGNPLAHGDTLDLQAPLKKDSDSRLTCCLLVNDPAFSELSSGHGSWYLRQLVGITKDEYDAINTWKATAFAEVMVEENMLLVTDLARASLLENEQVAARVHAGRERDGSSLGRVFATVCAWKQDAKTGKHRITVDNVMASSLGLQLRGRLLHQRRLVLVGPAQVVTLVPGEQMAFAAAEDGGLEVTVPPQAAEALSRVLRQDVGTYAAPQFPQLEFEVVPQPPSR